MSDNRFTTAALGALRLAQENAARLGHSYVGSEHLLLALASQEYSPASHMLRERGADGAALRRAIAQLVGTGVPSHSLYQGLTPGCRQVIGRAVLDCRRMGHPAVGDRHLLLALTEQDCSARRLLEDCGVDSGLLRRAVTASLGGEPADYRAPRPREGERGCSRPCPAAPRPTPP